MVKLASFAIRELALIRSALHDTSHDLARVQALDLRALNPRLPDERLVQEGLPVLDHEGARYLPVG